MTLGKSNAPYAARGVIGIAAVLALGIGGALAQEAKHRSSRRRSRRPPRNRPR